MSSSLFSPPQDEPAKEFGKRYNERYHMPLLPGELGTKSGGNWVPYGIMSATNLAGAFVDSRSLSVWERERTQMGLARRPELFERLVFEVNLAIANGADVTKLGESKAGVALKAILLDLHKQAKTSVGAYQASTMGTNRHDVWEARAKTGGLFGTPAINAEILVLESLLADNHLVRVPGLQERVVRNVALNASGRYDDILMSEVTGRLYMADLKTKRTPFYSWVETWIQQAVYATAEYMLNDERDGYVDGPAHHVDQEVGILLRMPSDGGKPYLERVDLMIGLRWAELARDITDARSFGKSKAARELAVWREPR